MAFAAQQQTDFAFPEEFGQGGLFVDGCSTDRVICYLYKPNETKGEVVGQSKPTPFCYDIPTKKCTPCSNPSIVCADSYPARCLSGQKLLCGGAAVP